MDKDNRKYANREITVYWRPKECIHAGICFTELSAVFSPHNRPWINLERASTKAIIAIVNRCPTSALTFSWNDPARNAAEPSPKAERNLASLEQEFAQQPTLEPVRAKVVRNGPLLVSGSFSIVGPDGQEMKRMRIASFCRCGQSGGMPFCDGTHFKCSFEG
jgi:uncharacterized Fe-S cluster protein YjdI